MYNDRQEGMIIGIRGPVHMVLLDDGSEVEALLRGRLRLLDFHTTHPVCVGDRVVCQQGEGGRWLIAEVLPRKNFMVRRAPHTRNTYHLLGANLDQCMLIVTLVEPSTPPGFIDRFLAAAQWQGISAIVFFNKEDLYGREERQRYRLLAQVYEKAGYRCILGSVLTGKNIDRIEALVRGKLTLLAGLSGVGKSSLIRALIPGVEVRVGEVSEKTGRGRHTTTFSYMYRLMQGGWLVDTPGIREFDIVQVEPLQVQRLFPEVTKYGGKCRFDDCLHISEPGCAVREAVERGVIARWRYTSYLRLVEKARSYKPWE